MIRLIVLALLLGCFACQSSQPESFSEFISSNQVQLSKPIVNIDSTFFRNSAQVNIDFRLEGAECMYSWNNTSFQKFEETIQIKESGILTVKNISSDFVDSELVYIPAIKVNTLLKDAEIKIAPVPSESYPGQGAASLNDQIKGAYNFRDGNWCGFQDSLIQLSFEIKEPKKIEKVFISTLTDITSSIFNPISLELFIDGEKIVEQNWKAEKSLDTKEFNIIPLSFSSTEAKTILLNIGNMTEVPDWHPNKGNKPWIFIDEIIIE